MLIHPWDAALEPAEWRPGCAGTDRFGMLAVNNLDPAQAPLVRAHPLHARRDDELLVHLARPEPGLAAPASRSRGPTHRGRRLRLHPDLLARQGRWARRGWRPDQLLRHRAVRLPPHDGRRPAGQGRHPRRPARRLPARGRPRRRSADSARTAGCSPASAASGSPCSGWRRSSSTTTTTPSSTASASSAASSSATAASTPGPLRSSDGVWPQSASGGPTGNVHDHQAQRIIACPAMGPGHRRDVHHPARHRSHRSSFSARSPSQPSAATAAAPSPGRRSRCSGWSTEPWTGTIDPVGVGSRPRRNRLGTDILLVGDRFSGITALSITVPVAAFTTAIVGVPQAAGHLTPWILAAALGLGLLHPVVTFALEMLALRGITPNAP